MANQTVLTLVNAQNGNLALKLFAFEDNRHFDHIQRNNYYSLIWLTAGKGKVQADFFKYDLKPGSLFAFSPYQPFMFSESSDLNGTAIQFHPDFFCIHKHQAEIACNGVLFNNIYQPPFVPVNDHPADIFKLLIEQMKTEMQHASLGKYELLVSYLKIFLITASRIRTEHEPQARQAAANLKEPFILQSLKASIEKDFKTRHSPSDYAKHLNISPGALAKLTKAHFNKTLTDLIAERIMIEAKRELYLTNKAIKEIAYELGYEDEHYFSRFFKVNAEISPQTYRDTVGFGRGSVPQVQND